MTGVVTINFFAVRFSGYYHSAGHSATGLGESVSGDRKLSGVELFLESGECPVDSNIQKIAPGGAICLPARP